MVDWLDFNSNCYLINFKAPVGFMLNTEQVYGSTYHQNDECDDMMNILPPVKRSIA